jgi:hypothetical protein
MASLASMWPRWRLYRSPDASLETLLIGRFRGGEAEEVCKSEHLVMAGACIA